MLVEVLSETTERFERGDKFAGYRSLPSVIDYVLIDQSRARVEHYVRQDDGTWVLREHDLQGALKLQSVPGSIPIVDIYRGRLVLRVVAECSAYRATSRRARVSEVRNTRSGARAASSSSA